MSVEKWKTEEWWVSEANYWDEVLAQTDMKDKVQILDSTLRDGEQTPGVVFRKEDKVKIARALDDLGVDRIEAGFPAVSEEDAEAIKAISKANLKAKVMALSRAMPADIDRAVDCGVDGVIIEVPAGKPRLLYQIPWSYEELLTKSIETIKYAKQKGLYASYFLVDGTRAERAMLKSLLPEVWEKARPDSVAVVDTSGTITPLGMFHLIKMIKSLMGCSIEVHSHNDLGMATANSIAGVQAGADVVHVCVNGMGERCGNAPLDEVAVSLKALCNANISIDLNKIYEVSKMVSEISGIPIQKNKAITGEFAFARESGLGIEAIFERPYIAYPIHPEAVNRKMELILGKKSGKGSIDLKLRLLGLKVNPDSPKSILQKVKERAVELRRGLTDEEFLAIVKDIDPQVVTK